MATTHYTTFWNFIKKEKIEIPIIQRDYAQGRNGQEKLREKLLKDLKKALDNPTQKLKLDFVYCSVQNEKLQPLDGQQRLTTLWLLHLYIAYKAGKLTENIETFKKFTYETRTSSREFCTKLSEFTETASGDIISHIQNQTWFYSAWKQDPTIQAMLNMLGGTDVTEKDADIVDGIEELFRDNFEEYWNILTGDNCPIIFYYLPLSDLKLSDDLYIKMNARGKPLTSFENFKADMVGYIKKRMEGNDANERWKQFGISTFENKLDTDWTDIFWKNKSDKSKIDEVYFAFLNRYLLNSLITKKKIDGAYSLSTKDIENHFLLGKKSDEYSGFEIYEPIFEGIEPFERLSNLLNNYFEAFKNIDKDEICKLFYAKWDETSKFRFIPEYIRIENNQVTISSLTESQRIVFHAICCYFEKNTFEETSFKQWLRVVWNIVENANVSKENLASAVRLIDELGLYSGNIYLHLKDRDTSNDFAKTQLKEEKEKARQIVENPEWETKIIEAENTAFFKGTIRFLFRTDEETYDWSRFDDKLVNCKKYFDEKGVKDGDQKYKSDAILLKAVISRCSDFEKFVWWDKYIFDNGAITWKWNLLLKNEWANAVHAVLLGNVSIVKAETTLLYRNLFESNLLNYVAKEMPDSRMRWIHEHHAIYQPFREGILLDDINGNYQFKRNEVLSLLYKEDKISSDSKIENCNFFFGWDIQFRLKNVSEKIIFQWNRNNRIYVFDRDEWKKDKEGKLLFFDGNKKNSELHNDLYDWMKNNI